jgi:hypothetical protein
VREASARTGAFAAYRVNGMNTFSMETKYSFLEDMKSDVVEK